MSQSCRKLFEMNEEEETESDILHSYVNLVNKGCENTKCVKNSLTEIFPKIIEFSNHSEFAKMQKEDLSLRGCFNLALKKKSGFYVQDKTGILFRTVQRKQHEKHLLVVPSNKRQDIINLAHSNNAHFAIKKTMQIINKNFYFPKMKENVKRN